MQKPWDVDLHVYADEQELLSGLQRGDRLACTCLLKRYAPRLLRLAQQMVGDADEAEDVLQEAFISACGHIGDFSGHSSLGTWLHRIVVNTALMHLRRSSSQNAPLSQDMPLPTTKPADLPEMAAMNAELSAAIDAALSTLPPTLRTAFVLVELDGMPMREAAEALGISLSAVKVRVYRARHALRAQLADLTTNPDLQPLPEEIERHLADSLCAQKAHSKR